MRQAEDDAKAWAIGNWVALEGKRSVPKVVAVEGLLIESSGSFLRGLLGYL